MDLDRETIETLKQRMRRTEAAVLWGKSKDIKLGRNASQTQLDVAELQISWPKHKMAVLFTRLEWQRFQIDDNHVRQALSELHAEVERNQSQDEERAYYDQVVMPYLRSCNKMYSFDPAAAIMGARGHADAFYRKKYAITNTLSNAGNQNDMIARQLLDFIRQIRPLLETVAELAPTDWLNPKYRAEYGVAEDTMVKDAALPLSKCVDAKLALNFIAQKLATYEANQRANIPNHRDFAEAFGKALYADKVDASNARMAKMHEALTLNNALLEKLKGWKEKVYAEHSKLAQDAIEGAETLCIGNVDVVPNKNLTATEIKQKLDKMNIFVGSSVGTAPAKAKE